MKNMIIYGKRKNFQKHKKSRWFSNVSIKSTVGKKTSFPYCFKPWSTFSVSYNIYNNKHCVCEFFKHWLSFTYYKSLWRVLVDKVFFCFCWDCLRNLSFENITTCRNNEAVCMALGFICCILFNVGRIHFQIHEQ